MHAAFVFLLVLTIHRCYPAGVPRFLQGNLIRRQIRNYLQTLCILWAFAIVINLPLFAITKYETHPSNRTSSAANNTSLAQTPSESYCYTEAAEIWSRTYLILLLVCTYLITGVFLIVIYGQAIRIILASKKYAQKPPQSATIHSDHYRFLSPHNIHEKDCQSKRMVRTNGRGNIEMLPAHSMSSSSTDRSNRRFPLSFMHGSTAPLVHLTTGAKNGLSRSPTNSHSAQHLQVIVMLFIVILLYILLLLPYRLLNLLYIVHNQIFQQTFMNEVMFEWLLNTVRLLVFLNCALQPITYLIISSRLRQTVLKLLRSWYAWNCHCRCRPGLPAARPNRQHGKSDTQAIRAYLSQKYQNQRPDDKRQKPNLYLDARPNQTSLNTIQLTGFQGLAGNHLTLSRSPSPAGPSLLTMSRSPSPAGLTRSTGKTRYVISFTNELRK